MGNPEPNPAGHPPPAAGPAGRAYSPLRQAIRRQPRILLAALLFTSGYGVMDYLSMVLLPTWAHHFGSVPTAQALRINTAGQALALAIVPLAGLASDRLLPRRTLLALAFAATAALAWPAFHLAAGTALAGRHAARLGPHPAAFSGLWPAQLALAFLLAIVMGCAPAFLAEQFAPEYRVSAHAVVFNLGIGIAGGTAPMAAMALAQAFHSPMAPAFYLAGAALFAALATLALRDQSHTPLEPRNRAA